MSKLPKGRFWCWYYDKAYVRFLDREPHEVEVRDRMGRKTGKLRWFASSEKIMPAELFTQIFGTAPKPGEALLLDASDWEHQCPLCDAGLRDYHGEARCAGCDCTFRTDWSDPQIRHAWVVIRKTLKEESDEVS